MCRWSALPGIEGAQDVLDSEDREAVLDVLCADAFGPLRREARYVRARCEHLLAMRNLAKQERRAAAKRWQKIGAELRPVRTFGDLGIRFWQEYEAQDYAVSDLETFVAEQDPG